MGLKFDSVEWTLCTKNNGNEYIYLCALSEDSISVIESLGVKTYSNMESFMKDYSPHEECPSYLEESVKHYYRSLFHNEASFKQFWESKANASS